VTIRQANQNDYAAIRHLLIDTGWKERVGDEAWFARLMDHSQRKFIADVDGRIVGFVRAVCDDQSNGYISMLAVAERYRHRGIGRELVRQLIGDAAGITWVLRAGRDSAGFWRKAGFKPSSIAMERLRNE